MQLGLPNCGISLDITRKSASGEKKGEKNDYSRKTTKAILSKTVSIILRSFDVKVRPNSEFTTINPLREIFVFFHMKLLCFSKECSIRKNTNISKSGLTAVEITLFQKLRIKIVTIHFVF